MSKHTLEQVLEALINKEEDRASDLLHQFFVNKGKQIYEEISSLEEEDLEEGIGGVPADDFKDEIIADEEELYDEQLFSEDEELDDMDDVESEEDEDGEMDDMASEELPSEEEATAELAMSDDAGEEAGEEQAVEVRVEDALSELKAAFAEIMGNDAEGMEDDEMAAIGESLVAVAAPTHGDNGQNTKSPVASTKRVDGNGASAVKINSGNVAGGKAETPTQSNAGNVNVPGNKKAPVLKSVAVPKTTDTAGNKTSPVAKK